MPLLLVSIPQAGGVKYGDVPTVCGDINLTLRLHNGAVIDDYPLVTSCKLIKDGTDRAHLKLESVEPTD